MGPLGKALGGWLKLGGAFLGGVKYEKARQTRRQLKHIKKVVGAKNEIENRISNLSSDRRRRMLLDKWSK